MHSSLLTGHTETEEAVVHNPFKTCIFKIYLFIFKISIFGAENQYKCHKNKYRNVLLYRFFSTALVVLVKNGTKRYKIYFDVVMGLSTAESTKYTVHQLVFW